MRRGSFLVAIIVAASFALPAAPAHSQAVPVAASDTFTVAAGGSLTVPAPGVLSNDSAADSLVAVAIASPTHGSLSLRADGSLEYTPDAGFEGTDRFTYTAQVLPLYSFAVDPGRSNLVFQAALDAGAYGSDADTDSSRAEGVIEAYLTPDASGISHLHIRTADIVMSDSVEVLFTLLVGSLHALAQPDSLRMTMLEAGATVPLQGGEFVQAENELRLGGTVFLTPTGALIFAISKGPVVIENLGPGDIGGTLVEVDGSYELHLPVLFAGTIDMAGSSLDIALSGMVVASAAVQVPAASAETEVVVHVGAATARSGSDPGVPADFALMQNYPNPFNPATTIRYEVAAAGAVTLEVFDVLGRSVEVLVDGWQAAGRYAVTFEAGNLPGGLYFYRLKAGDREQTRPMLLLK